MSNADFVDFVNLTASGQDAAREYLVAQEILEPTGHDPDKRSIRVASVRSSATDSDKIKDSEEYNNDNNIDYKSDASDLPSLADIFPRSYTRFRARSVVTGGDSEDSANPAATVATGIQLGPSQDEPIVLDDDQPLDIPDTAAHGDKNPTFKVTDPRIY
ncbi:hypothetical protein DV737_g1343, partial [Chaetothyriales sp. CBS 132003]